MKRVSPRAIGLGSLVAVVALGLVAYFATKPSSNSGANSATQTASVGQRAVESVVETGPVSVSGVPLVPHNDSGADASIGTAAPTLTGVGFDSKVRVIKPGGAPKIVMFVAHWCPHCQAEVPLIAKSAPNGTIDGVEVHAVSTGVVAERPNYPPSQWLDPKTWPIPTLVDDGANTAAMSYGLTGFPYFVVINSSGNVVKRTSGELSEKAFQALVLMAKQ
jgi:cytochrome c biogenesis protein CcmG, thiol:disulfide interchange protein DsbE